MPAKLSRQCAKGCRHRLIPARCKFRLAFFLRHEGSCIFHAIRPIILASGSPRRAAFLAALGLAATCIAPPEGAEPGPAKDEAPAAYAVRAAEAKLFATLPAALAGADGPKGPVLIAADTIVVCGGVILGKPRNQSDALGMLLRLAGKTHSVITGCSVLAPESAAVPQKKRGKRANYSAVPDGPGLPGAAPISFSVASEVCMWNAPEPVLRAYVAGGEPLDKAGAYAVQGVGSFLVSSVNGSWSSVVGLPLAELVAVLLDIKAIAPVNS